MHTPVSKIAALTICCLFATLTYANSLDEPGNATACVISGNETCWNDLRLPKDLVPQSYEILIHPDLERFDFRGWSCVEVFVNTSVNYIVMHTKDLNITINDIRYKIYSEKIEVERHFINGELEQLFIKLSSHLLRHSAVLINVSFHGILNKKEQGFFRSSYKINSIPRFFEMLCQYQ
ncbi:hypothetical protein HELRODRAFT_177607 [Helobdella robusta]|uniref:Aminopeptidase N-like N-terminal domain-containing protein n=1 Tax=Helobdella robusta TaxID=6412 RepID=T1FBX8_HELRO|nr:hypothetical protein HELRODRAFT_177607 [Helobdella robusta]ESN97943.1 hypothetical protein HELRODRAFT_177607 [Helobdella robusta]